MYKKGPVSLDPKYINLRYKIGSGFFGEVFLATIPLRSPVHAQDSSCGSNVYTNNPCSYIQVAVKVLKDSSLLNSRVSVSLQWLPLSCPLEQQAELLKEAAVMATLDHKHILRLIGVACEDHALKTPFMMVLELAPLGPMSSFLATPEGQGLTTRHILVLMLQVAMGMQFLESKNYVHRDLAARNVLLVNESFAKISDFGMSKALGLGKDYYQARAGSKWPLKWFAPECIYFFKFSAKSDVWAFGVTLWEGLSYGARPYEGMDSEAIMRFLNNHGQQQRLPPPKGTPEVIHDLMTKCWAYRPEDRPNFGHIVQTLTSFLFLPNNSSSKLL
jgi:serine/threonine protein kinase